jgi:hypothetical protein
MLLLFLQNLIKSCQSIQFYSYTIGPEKTKQEEEDDMHHPSLKRNQLAPATLICIITYLDTSTLEGKTRSTN